VPIFVNLDRMLLERGMTLTELAERVGITIANLSILKTNKARAVRFSTLDALCRELECQPSDLLEFRPDEGRPIDAKVKAGLAFRGRRDNLSAIVSVNIGNLGRRDWLSVNVRLPPRM